MALGLKTTRNAVYQTAYHAVWISKYRRRVLTEAVADRLRGLISEVAQAKGFEIVALEIQRDHIHLFFSAPPAVAPSLAIQWFKGSRRAVSSRRFRMCAASSGVATCGHRPSTSARRARYRPRRSGATSSARSTSGRRAEC